MSKKIRDGLLIVFIILFVILTAITSLYASGYKFNLSWPLKFNRLLQKTGMLAVATKPSRAIIFLDNKPQQDLSFNPWKNEYITTPNKIKNILPDKYELSLELDGYWPYRETINIYSGETTFVEDVILFRKSSPALVMPSPETNLLISPDYRYLYTETNNRIINLKTEEFRNLTSPQDAGTNDLLIRTNNLAINKIGQWLKNNKFFKDGIIFDALKETADNNYRKIIGPEANDWQYEEAGGLIYFRHASGLSRLATANQATDLILKGTQYSAYQSRGNQLLAITDTPVTKLIVISVLKQVTEADWTLPNNGRYVFTNNIYGRIGVYDYDNKTLYLFNENNIGAGPIIINNINNWEPLDDDQLIYSNDYELYIFDLKTAHHNLITRRSEKITNLIWNKTSNYLIFTSPETINIFDFKNRHATELLKTNRLASPALDEKNHNLYFWANIDGVEGIYKINLR